MEIAQFVKTPLRFNGRYFESEVQDQIFYPASGHGSLYQHEDHSFWFLHRNRCILSLVRRFQQKGPLFDVGGGNGSVSYFLQKKGLPTVTLEPGVQGVENAVHRGVKIAIKGTLESIDFVDGALPSAGLFDVLEHIPDDVGFLMNLNSKMMTGGTLFITVPAYNILWSAEDDFAGHHRRYTRRGLHRVLRAAGFEVRWSSYFFVALLLPILLLRALPSRLGLYKIHAVQNDHLVSKSPIERVISWLCSVEERFLRYIRLPFGSSILLVAVKR